MSRFATMLRTMGPSNSQEEWQVGHGALFPAWHVLHVACLADAAAVLAIRTRHVADPQAHPWDGDDGVQDVGKELLSEQNWGAAHQRRVAATCVIQDSCSSAWAFYASRPLKDPPGDDSATAMKRVHMSMTRVAMSLPSEPLVAWRNAINGLLSEENPWNRSR